MVRKASCALLLLFGMFLLADLTQKYCQAQEAGAAAGGDAAKPEAKKEQGMSGIEWFIRSSGLIGLFILGLSIYFVALVIRLFMELKKELAVPPDVVGRCEDLIKERNFQECYNLARDSESFFGRVLSMGIAELPNGLPDACEVMDRTAEAETVEMEKKISMLAVMGTLGPMIGLIGTLKGMIASFSVIAMSGVTLKASEVAGGISEALLLTFEGVGLSVPSIYFFAFFRNRVMTISVTAKLEADRILRHFYRTGRTKASPAAATQAQAKARATATEG